MSGTGRLNVGPADAIRCALGLLLPAWFYTVGLVTGVAAASGSWSASVNTGAAVGGFAVAACVEVLRRLTLLRRPNGGRSVTMTLRTIATALPVVGAVSAGLLTADLATGCFGRTCGEDATIAAALWLGMCVLCLLSTPLLMHLLRRSAWLQVR